MLHRRCASLLVVAVLAAGCGASSAPSAGDVVDNYLYALAEGSYGNACKLLDRRARASLQASGAACPTVLARCLQNRAVALKRDQTQQLFADVSLSLKGSKGEAVIRGTAVARTVREVTLADEHGTWRLTSAGTALQRCRR